MTNEMSCLSMRKKYLATFRAHIWYRESPGYDSGRAIRMDQFSLVRLSQLAVIKLNLLVSTIRPPTSSFLLNLSSISCFCAVIAHHFIKWYSELYGLKK